MSTTQAWYVSQRAEALAQVLLTRRADLIVKPQDDSGDTGIDLIVEIRPDKEATAHIFGVVIKAQVAAFAETPPVALYNGIGSDKVVHAPHPVCLFFFTMEDNQGFYRWITEPIVIDQKTPKLRASSTDSLSPLNTAALDRIVSQVQQWYDALYASLTL